METVKITGSISEKTKDTIVWGIIGSLLLCVFLLVLCDGEIAIMFLLFGFSIIVMLLGITYWMMCKMQIIVTDKRVMGRTRFGRSVDLPIDSISAVGANLFNGITVSTSSGVIKFFFIENADLVRKELCALLIQRQETKKAVDNQSCSADELKKYKELADEGILTQEEFEKIKKQLLGL